MKLKFRRAQSEVIGGLIVLTILFMIAMPVILDTFRGIQWRSEIAEKSLDKYRSMLNEKITLEPADPVITGGLPGLWINNTGTISVYLRYLYMIYVGNGTIYRIYDLRNIEPHVTPDIVNVTKYGGPGPVYKLNPGESLLIIFSDEISRIPLSVKVSTDSGMIHPVTGTSSVLLTTRESGSRSSQGGVFNPEEGYYAGSGNELLDEGSIIAWRPRLYITLDAGVSEYRIYTDPANPALSKIELEVTRATIIINGKTYRVSGSLVVEGFLGVFQPYTTGAEERGAKRIFLNGYATRVSVEETTLDEGGIIMLGPQSYGVEDIDGDGTDELVAFSLHVWPTLSSTVNPDSDENGDLDLDGLAWSYVYDEEVEEADYVRLTAKIMYTYKAYDLNGDSCPLPEQSYTIVAAALWRKMGDGWKLVEIRPYLFAPGQAVIQIDERFILDGRGEYRVGLILYDPYTMYRVETSGRGSYCFLELTHAIEYLAVEYGQING